MTQWINVISNQIEQFVRALYRIISMCRLAEFPHVNGDPVKPGHSLHCHTTGLAMKEVTWSSFV